MTQERAPAHAGTYYPENPESLSSLVQTLLEGPSDPFLGEIGPDLFHAFIVPHGEYARSGQVAASAFRILRNRTKRPERILIVAPLHHWPEYGLILPTFPSYRIPTGSLPVDRKTIQQLAFFPETLFSDEAHISEYSVEIQLPFLFKLWGAVPIVPLGYADLPADVLARILGPFLSDPDTLVLVSADLSRYFNAHQAEVIDRETIERINSCLEVDPLRVCGATGVNALGLLARKGSLTPRLLMTANSEENTGDSSLLTGYASFGFYG